MTNLTNDGLRRVVEDHALVVDFLIHASRCIQEGLPMPTHIPSLHDGLVMDALGNVVGAVTRLRGELADKEGAL